MTTSWTVSTRFAAFLRNFVLILGALSAFTVAHAATACAEPVAAADEIAPPTIVIDADFVPARAVGHVVYVPHDQEMLAMDASGSIRAVFPAPARVSHGTTTGFAALTAGSVSVPAFGIVLLATLFAAMVGIIFLRRTPASA